jgi:predicted esterase
MYKRIEIGRLLAEVVQSNQPDFFPKVANCFKRVFHTLYPDGVYEDVRKSSAYMYEVIRSFLSSKLTTIGHSQGAVYAYKYGHMGHTTIVVNPALLPRDTPATPAPSNLHIIRFKKDFISLPSTLRHYKTATYHTFDVPDPTIHPHQSAQLKALYKKFGTDEKDDL